MLKKVCVVFLLVFAICTFSACREPDIRGTVSSNSTSSTVSEAEFSLGVSADQTYESTFLGIGCRLDANWVFYTDEQIRQLNNITTDLVGEEYAAALEKASIVYDMYASDTNTGSTININLENLSLANQLALSEEAYVKVATAGVQGALESAGFTDVSCEPATFTLAGREHAGMKVTAMAQNIPVYEAIVCIKTGGYMANLTVCTFGEDQTQALLDKFYAVN